jgi:hypothetical protein
MEILRMDANQTSSSVLPNNGGDALIDPADTVFLMLNHHLLPATFFFISLLSGLLAYRIYSRRMLALHPCSSDSSRSRPANRSSRADGKRVLDPAFAWLLTIRSAFQNVSSSLAGPWLSAVLVITIDFSESVYVIVSRAISPDAHALSTLTAAAI